MTTTTHISNNNGAQTTNGLSNQAQQKAALNADDFMKIFLAQMQAQDPTQPFDSTAMMQQMSAMTTLSATDELQKSIDTLNVTMGQSEMFSASQMIDKKAVVISNVSPLTDDGLNGSLLITEPATNITVTIKDPSGKVVQVIDKGSAQGSGIIDFSWDGKDADGNKLDNDYYQISATAKVNGQQTDLMVAGSFKVDSVAMDRSNNSVILNLEGYGGTSMDNIIKIT